MKQKGVINKITIIIPICITLLGSIINLISYKIMNTILLGMNYSGGEVITKVGFGIVCDKFYPLTDDPNASVSTQLSFSIMNFLIYFIVIFVIVLLISLIINKIKKAK